MISENYKNIEGQLSKDWIVTKGVNFEDYGMILYRPEGNRDTKKLQRVLNNDATGMVTIAYTFENVGASEKSVDFFLGVKDTAGTESTVLNLQHVTNDVRVNIEDAIGNISYQSIMAVNANDKHTAKIVVNTLLNKLTVTIDDKTKEYIINLGFEATHVSNLYWDIPPANMDAGIKLYDLSVSTMVTDDLRLQADLTEVTVDYADAIKDSFTLPLKGKYGSTFHWETDTTTFVSINSETGQATITRPSSDESAKLIITGTLNEASITKEIPVIIRKKLSTHEENVERDKDGIHIPTIVTADLTLIRTGNCGSDILWVSNNRAVISNKGEVTVRDTDEFVKLTATITSDNVSDTKEFDVVVPANNTDKRPVQKQRNMTDEEFLGIWDHRVKEWIAIPKINYGYDNNPTLKAAEESVKKGNYNKAKELIHQYYISKNRTIENPTIKRKDTSYVKDLMADVYSHLEVLTSGTVSSEMGYHTFDLTNSVVKQVKLAQSSMDLVIVNEDKNEEIIFDSREGTKPPVLTVVADSQEYKINPIADSYIRAGKYGENNYGSERYLKALDSGMPVDDDSKRIYIRFNIPQIPTMATIERAELSFYGFARQHDPKNPTESNEVDESVKLSKPATIMICKSEELNFNEDSIKWNAPLRIKHYSYKGNTEKYGAMDYLHHNKPGIDKQFININARFWHHEGLIGKYEATGDEKYAARYIRELLCYYNKVGGGDLLLRPDIRSTNVPLNAGFREQLITDAYYAIVGSKSMTPVDNLQILKFIYDDAEALLKEIYWAFAKNNNWGMEMLVGNQSIIESFPEFATTNKNLKIIADRMSFLLGHLIRTDGAYIEGTNGYPVHVFENIYGYKKAMMKLNYKVPDRLDRQIKRFATFFINCLEPNGYIAEYGDDHYDQQPHLFNEIAEIARIDGDTEMLYVATDRKEGTEPLHQSAFYPDGKWATLRDGWDEDSLFSFVNWMPIDTHSHNDVLGLTLTAYGRRLLADTSDKSYNNDPVSVWQRASRFSHNVVAIDEVSCFELYNREWSNPNMSSTANANLTKAHDILTTQLLEKGMPDGDYVSHRKIIFLKPLKFFIVSDYLNAVKGSHKYTQSWIFDPKALPSIDSKTGGLRTNFEEGANIFVVPNSNDEMEQSIEDGYHETTAIEYAKFVKHSEEVETFDTVLYPIEEGSKTQISTEKIDMGDNRLVSAMTIEFKIDGNNHENGSYYISHEDVPTYREFGVNATDATMVYVHYDCLDQVKYALIQNGTVLKAGEKNVIKSDIVLSDVSVEYKNEAIYIVSSEKSMSNLGNLEILAVNDAAVVYFNEVSVPYCQSGNTISFKVEKETQKENLAIGKTVTGADSQIVDGNPNTSWKQTVCDYPKTITIDLGEEKNVAEVEVLWGISETQNGVYNYQLQTSLDGTNFVGINRDRGFERSLIEVDKKARYIKLVVENNTFCEPIEIRGINVTDW